MAELAQDPVAAVRAQLNGEMSHVMDNSQPTPTQAEIDGKMLGRIESFEHRDAPRMRSLEEQQSMIADAEENRAVLLGRERAERDRVASASGGSVLARAPPPAQHQDVDEANREAARRQAAARAQQPRPPSA